MVLHVCVSLLILLFDSLFMYIFLGLPMTSSELFRAFCRSSISLYLDLCLMSARLQFFLHCMSFSRDAASRSAPRRRGHSDLSPVMLLLIVTIFTTFVALSGESSGDADSLKATRALSSVVASCKERAPHKNGCVLCTRSRSFATPALEPLTATSAPVES